MSGKIAIHTGGENNMHIKKDKIPESNISDDTLEKIQAKLQSTIKLVKTEDGIIKLKNDGYWYNAPKEAVGITVDGAWVISGSFVFELRATHGYPLFMSVSAIYDAGMVIDWVDFVECARRNKWWDFRTYAVMLEVLQDSGIPKETQQGIIHRFKLYVVNNPHPMMIGVE